MSKKRRITNKEIKLLDKEKKKVELLSSEPMKLLTDDTQAVKKAVEQKELELKEQKEMFLRKLAESENSKRIMRKETDMLIENANIKFLKEVLGVVDNFDRAVESAHLTDDKERIIEGIKLIDRQFHQVFEKMGVKAYESKGERFDPSKHEAISVQTNTKYQDGIVIEEHQKGYTFSGRVLRPAKVIVNKIDSENKEEIND